jgi:hypothetical protein
MTFRPERTLPGRALLPVDVTIVFASMPWRKDTIAAWQLDGHVPVTPGS